jgi:methyl-accepting chemotaxis protein
MSLSLSIKLSVLGGAVLALVFGGGTAVLVHNVGGSLEAEVHEVQLKTAESEARLVKLQLDGAAIVADSIVGAVVANKTAGVTDRASYDAVLRSLLERNPQILGTWTGWEPNALDGKDASFVGKDGSDGTGRFISYWNRGGGAIKREALVGYDKPGDGDYYLLPKQKGRAVAIEPYIYPVAGKEVLMMSFGVPIEIDGRYAGTGGVDIDLSAVNAQMGEIRPFGTGFVSIASAGGIAVAHPNATLQGKKLADGDPALARVAAAATKANSPITIDDIGSDGAAWRYAAYPIEAGKTSDRWVVVAAVPVATLASTVQNAKWVMVGLSSFCALLVCGLLFGVMRAFVGRPLNKLSQTVDRMAAGDYGAEIQEAERGDEVGAIGKAVARFRDELQTKAAAEAELKTSEQASLAQHRRNTMMALAEEFERAVGGIVEVVTSAATEMESAAGSLSATANEAARQSSTIAMSTTQAAANVQTVAAASEELTSSVAEIDRQVAQSNEISAKAVEEARQTDARIRGLVAAAEKVGQVVDLIQAIAGQTNLLALNATIEAARAGEAGRGFAVVANEVKSLASQTARATNEISSHIASIQSETSGSAKAISLIGSTIAEMNTIAQAIAAAVAQQRSATAEISKNVQEAAQGTDEVARNVAGVSEATSETGAAASQVLATAGELSQQAATLRTQVTGFLARVRAA